MTVLENGVATEVMAVGFIIERNESLKWQIAWWDVILPHWRGLSGEALQPRDERPTSNRISQRTLHQEPLTTNHKPLTRPVHQHRGDTVEELAQHRVDILGQLHLVERVRHQLQPALARGGVDRERHVPHPQARMAALLDVALRAAEAADQKIAQPLLGARKIAGRIHRSENLI